MRESVKCRATCRHSKEPCKNQAIKGATVCRMHGGATPQVKRKAAERMLLRTPMMAGPPRHPWEVLLDALNVADVLMRDEYIHVQSGEPLDPGRFTRLVESIDRASRMAKVTLDARAQEHMQLHTVREAELVVHVLNAAIEAAGLDLDQEARARAAMRRALETLDGRSPVIDGTVSQNRALSGGSTS